MIKPVLLLITSLLCTSVGLAVEVTKKDNKHLDGKIVDLIEQHYVLKDRIPTILAKFKKSADQISPSTTAEYAKHLTNRLFSASYDKHLYIEALSLVETETETDWDAWEVKQRQQEIQKNFGFQEMRILQGNIGYLKISEFMHPSRGMPTAVASMQWLGSSDALIIDIRGNGGGYPELMLYILNHYFDPEPIHLSTTYYADQHATPYVQYSSPAILGRLRTGEPLAILVNEKTGSAAEYFAYTLQAFGKARIIGSPTAGAAHMNSFYELNNQLRISISTAAPINPLSKTNWEGTGVVPDIIASKNVIEAAVAALTESAKVTPAQ